jgi:hypothetical protein
MALLGRCPIIHCATLIVACSNNCVAPEAVPNNDWATKDSKRYYYELDNYNNLFNYGKPDVK